MPRSSPRELPFDFPGNLCTNLQDEGQVFGLTFHRISIGIDPTQALRGGWRDRATPNPSKTMSTDTNKESEMSPEELAAAAGGSRNIDNPLVRTAINAFNQTIKDGEAAKRAA